MTEDHKTELGEPVAMLESAGLLIQTVDEGKPALQITPKGAQVARQMAMSSEEDAFAMHQRLWTARLGRRRPGRRGPVAEPSSRADGVREGVRLPYRTSP